MMTKDFKDLLRAFNANVVKYLIIGAHAFGVHAQPRTTKDLDLFIRSHEENAKAAFRALVGFGDPMQGATECKEAPNRATLSRIPRYAPTRTRRSRSFLSSNANGRCLGWRFNQPNESHTSIAQCVS